MSAPKQNIIGLDFDGTCVTHEFPKVGREIGAVPVLKELVDAGYKLILWTMRSDGREQLNARNGEPLANPNPLTDAVNWFKENGIELYGIQRNPTQDAWTSSPKAYAHIYIDDAALGAPLIYPEGERPHIDWAAVHQFFFPPQQAPCLLCAGADQDSDFDYCRACGRIASPRV